MKPGIYFKTRPTPAIPNSKSFDDDPTIIDPFWWGWAGLFDTYWYQSRLASINPPLRHIRISLNLELLAHPTKNAEIQIVD